MKRYNLEGQLFGRLMVMGDAGSFGGQRYWRCLCFCGNYVLVTTSRLRQGNKKSCGCLRSELARTKGIKHGYTGTKLYRIWEGIIGRCHNPRATGYEYYGARGIYVCDEWKTPENFIVWAIANGWEPGLEIDRIDPEGPYAPENCRFVSRQINCMNHRLYKTNTTGFHGVTFDKARNRFMAQIQIAGKHKYLGRYVTAEEAAKARDAYVIANDLPYQLNFGESYG